MRIKKTASIVMVSTLTTIIVAAVLAWRATGSFTVDVPPTLLGDAPGDLRQVTRIGTYPAFVMRYAAGTVGLDALEIEQGCSLYRVEYVTTAPDGSLVEASGLVSIPGGESPVGTIVYLHGTNTQRDRAPSSSEFGEGVLVSAGTTGAGHLLIAPDYIGLGESQARHPYLHAKTVVSTTLDLMTASRTWLRTRGVEWPEALFLMGFSQGGHAAFAVQRELERMDDPPFAVTASAPVAGPFQLRDVSFPQALTGVTDSHELYLAFLTSAYADVYGQPLGSVLKDRFVDTIPAAFDGNHSYREIEDALPELPTDLFTEEFLEAYSAGESHWFLEALAENDVFDWTPKAPVRIYYGERDVDVLPREALEAASAMSERGADVTAISVGELDHNESVLVAIPLVLEWFGELAGD